MLQAIILNSNGINFGDIVLAIGSLGTAAYGVVDATKGFGGGISNRGMGDIKAVMSKFFGGSVKNDPQFRSTVATLRANWMNGMALGDQKAVAKSLIRLNLTSANADQMAAATGVRSDTLNSIAGKMSNVKAFSNEETDAFGRFNLKVESLLDQAYQRADQRYRNSSKLLAVPIAVILAVLGARTVYGANANYVLAVIAGLIATPLAPVAKDVASAIQAGTKVAQTWKK